MCFTSNNVYHHRKLLIGFMFSILTFSNELATINAFLPSTPLPPPTLHLTSYHEDNKNKNTLFLRPSRTYFDSVSQCRLFQSSSLSTQKGSDSTTSAESRPSGQQRTPPRKNNNHKNRNRNARPRGNHKHYSNNFNNPNDPLYKAKVLNSKIIKCDMPSDVLSTFVSCGGARGTAGNKEMNTVNFSTSLHRVAKTCSMFRPRDASNPSSNPPTQKQFRTMTLTDPRFAILLCAVSEAFVEMKDSWNCRELSNISWALAKINFVPDSNSISLPPYIEDDDGRGLTKNVKSCDDQALLMSAKRLRESVILAGKEQKSGNNALYAELNKRWISQMRILAAHLLDGIAYHVQFKLLEDFKSQELANMIWALATIGRGETILFDALVKRLLEFNKSKMSNSQNATPAKPQELSNSIWAFATSGLSGEGQISLMKYIAQSFIDEQSTPNYISQFKPQELSNTAWGVATIVSKRSENNKLNSNPSKNEMSPTLIMEEEASAFQIIREIASAFLGRMHEFKTQELSNTVWAMATIGFADPESPHSRLPDDAILLKNVLQKAAVDALPRLRRFSPQELNCLGWAYARLSAERSPEIDLLFAGIGEEVRRRIRYFSAQDVGTTLWSFATMGYNDLPDVFTAAASRVTIKDAHLFKPQELSNSVWALATIGMGPTNKNLFDTTLFPDSKKVLMDLVMREKDVIAECFTAAAMEIMKRPQLFKEQELKDVLWSFSKSGLRHPELFKTIAQHVLGDSTNTGKVEDSRLMDFSPQGIGNFVWSYARQAQLSNEPSEKNRELGKNGSSSSSGRLAVYETMCLDVGEDLVNRLFATVAGCSLKGSDRLSAFKPQDMSNTVWAFATLGLLHREFFTAVAEEVEKTVAFHTNPSISQSQKRKKESFKPQEVSNLLWAYATLNCHTKSSMIHTLTPYILQMCSSTNASKGVTYDEKSISSKFNRQELANLAWSCSVLRKYPEDLIPLLYTGLMGEDEESMDRLTRLYDDNGLQKKSIMSLLYVQMALDLEAPHLNMKLPPKLLESFSDQDSRHESLERSSENELMLLSTSKLQKSVSNVLEKIGFDHIQEHVLGADDLQAYGITLSSTAVNFLSIDIADVESKIGVEVDGPSHFINILDEALGKTNKGKGSRVRTKSGKMWVFEWDGERQVNGPTALKDRLLAHLGWQIIHLPFWEWNNLNDEASQSTYCKELLNKAEE